MSRPMHNSSIRHSHGLPSHPHRKRKISAPPQLKAHLEGSHPSTPSLRDIGSRSSFNENITEYASSSSSVVNTPKPTRSPHFFLSSSENVFEQSQEQSQSGLRGYDNQSFRSNENLSSSIPADEENTTSGESSRALGGSGSTIADTKPLNVVEDAAPTTSATDEKLYNRSVSAVFPISNQHNTNQQVNDSFIDTQSIFTDKGSPTTYPAGVFFEGSITSQELGKALREKISNGLRSEVDIEMHVPPATEPKQRKEWLVSSLSTNMSIVYILFVIVAGIVCYLMDMFAGKHSDVSESFNMFLILFELLWLAYIHMDVRRYIGKVSHLLKKSNDGDFEDKGKLEQNEQNTQKIVKEIPQHYGFTFSSHGGSLYLKIGATGHLILTGLEITSKTMFLTHDDPEYRACTSVTDLFMSAMQLVSVFYQLFFAFKFSNLIINKRLVISKFGIMHCIGSSLCFWLYAIIQETIHSLSKKDDYGDGSGYNTTSSPYQPNASDNEDSKGSLYMGCKKNTPVSGILKDAAPYLYPFSIEFNILIVGFWILLWENLGKIEKHNHMPSIEVTYEDDQSKALASNLIIHVDCHASSRGIFAGLFVTIASILSIILFFVFSSSDSTLDAALLINSVSELIVVSIMFVTSVIAFYYIRRLDVLQHKISVADDILLYVCLPFVFLYAFFTMVPYAMEYNGLYVADNIMKVLQVILQTALIVDGLRRCANTHELRRHKPGRGVVTFLVVTNVAMWLLMSFQIINTDGNATLYEFYGKELWTAISHLTLPLALFYRFHSSVCLVDIWKASYEQEDH